MSPTHSYQTKSAVLFIIFNRPGTTGRVFEEIKRARPPRLYIAADGARQNVAGEDGLCEEARKVAAAINWPCQLKTLFRDTNLGCRDAVSSGITWFFNHEEEGIILEDDCLPSNDFFAFCDEMLEHYRADERVRHICGCNFQYGKTRGEGSYYFSNLTHVWGWAGWRRVWQGYDSTLANYATAEVRTQLANIFSDELIVDAWADIFDQVKAGEINTWDYQYTFMNFFNHGLSIIPNGNLITNIGFGEGATHTFGDQNRYANIPHSKLSSIQHPKYMLPQKAADYDTLAYDFDIEVKRKKLSNRSAKFKRWLKGK